LTAPCVRPDVSKMQSVRHTPACIPFGGWYVQGVETAWPAVSGASPHMFPVGISSSCQCNAYVLHGHSSGNGTRPGVAFFGDAAVAAQHLTGQNVSVHGVLARLHIHTGRLSWGDFGFEFWDLHEASASARPCSMGPTLLQRAPCLARLDGARQPHSP
jgi:hypothetical protein